MGWSTSEASRFALQCHLPSRARYHNFSVGAMGLFAVRLVGNGQRWFHRPAPCRMGAPRVVPSRVATQIHLLAFRIATASFVRRAMIRQHKVLACK